MWFFFVVLKFIFYRLLPDQFFGRVSETIEDLTGRTYLITGGNNGVGLATAVHLARMRPARIILAVRNVEKGEKAKAEIVAETGYTGKMEVWELELSSFASVKAFGERANSELERLDGAILNAAYNGPDWNTTVDGWEYMIQVNLLATGFLGALLLPLLNKTTSLPQPLPDATPIAPHLALVGSSGQYIARFPERSALHILDALNDKKHSNIMDRYMTTKLLIILFARELAALPLAQGVVVNVTDPGLCKSGLGRDFEMPPIAEKIYGTIVWPAAKGALNVTYSALRPTPPAAYVAVCQVRKYDAWVYTAEGQRVQKQLWKEASDLWRSVDPSVSQIIS
ncbi:hypothetical protein MKEN_01099700 [Mycena kentingensis (nom. inval.)]|nr:hypothetical protein MKEN_01099700 [Mycena kentingensis (nom. inval.)]